MRIRLGKSLYGLESLAPDLSAFLASAPPLAVALELDVSSEVVLALMRDRYPGSPGKLIDAWASFKEIERQSRGGWQVRRLRRDRTLRVMRARYAHPALEALAIGDQLAVRLIPGLGLQVRSIVPSYQVCVATPVEGDRP